MGRLLLNPLHVGGLAGVSLCTNVNPAHKNMAAIRNWLKSRNYDSEPGSPSLGLPLLLGQREAGSN